MYYELIIKCKYKEGVDLNFYKRKSEGKKRSSEGAGSETF